MFLKRLELQNIRSYSRAEVAFGEGVLLFEGDVGCGKSSILYAIEFALFGLGDLNASFLLRNSAQSGFVRLCFEVGGREYEVFRTLEKKKTSVQQGECFIIADGKKTLYTPSEMKPAVLQILGFKEPSNPRSQSIIYRYAVFTPQEEMKKILEEKSEERLQTLRKAFGVEEYRIARDNSAIVLKDLREEARFLEGQAADLPQLEGERVSLESRVEQLVVESAGAAGKAKAAEEALANAKKQFLEIQSQLSSFRTVKAELPLIEKRLEDLRSALGDALEQTGFLESEVADFEQQLSEFKIVEIDYSKTQAEYKKVREQSAALANEIGALQGKQKDYALLKERGVCPTCGQAISGDFEKHASELAALVVEKQGVLEKLKDEEEDLAMVLEKAVQQNASLQRKKDLEKRVEKNRVDLRALAQKTSLLQEELPVLEKMVAEKRSALASLAGVEENARALEKTVLAAEAEFKTAFSQKTRLETQLAEAKHRAGEIEKRIVEKRVSLAKLAGLKERKAWLEEHFIPSLSAIETHVLAGLNREFGLLFKKWFSLLVESQDLNVEAGEQFEPLVEINGYEHSYQTLSGGEKSALALAYRLALNALVKSVSASMQENLLILDEPTDGFSKEQLGCMRSVLNELNCKQVLLVSHERELETFADKVFRVEKKDGVSVIF
ncbi:MAG: AAA family ATPase [Candidatus Norongarragalinales archaeon]